MRDGKKTEARTRKAGEKGAASVTTALSILYCTTEGKNHPELEMKRDIKHKDTIRHSIQLTAVAYLTPKVDHDVLGLIAAKALLAARVQDEPREPQQGVAADNATAALVVGVSAVGTAVGATVSDAIIFSFVVAGRLAVFLCGPCAVGGGGVLERRFLSVVRRG